MTRVLVEPESPWPPPGHSAPLKRAASWAAWWGGEPAQLRKHAAETAPGGYWATRALADPDQVHLPIAADLAHTSADLLAGDAPTLTWSTTGTADLWAEQARTIGWSSSLLEAAETSSPLGGVYLRPQWDDRIGQHALLTIVRPDEAIPTFLFGHLIEVVFVRQLTESGEIVRWLEHHEPGQIRHELWNGTPDRIGRSLPLTEHPVTAGLTAVINTSEIRPGILVEWAPNLLPQPLTSLATLGRSDLQGVETLMDALDRTWSSWVRDIRLGKGRLLVAGDMLDDAAAVTERRNAGGRRSPMLRWLGNREDLTASGGRRFDEDAEIFSPLPGWDSATAAGGKPIEQVQFKIRVEEHDATCTRLVREIVQRAGRAPQTMGDQVEGQISGVATQLRERRSFRTRDRQRDYFTPAVERVAETMLRINVLVFGVGAADPGRPTLAWPDVDLSEPEAVARTIALLRTAKAVSVETAVRMAHPDWEDPEVLAEVRKILDEQPAAPTLDGLETPDEVTPPPGERVDDEPEPAP